MNDEQATVFVVDGAKGVWTRMYGFPSPDKIVEVLDEYRAGPRKESIAAARAEVEDVKMTVEAARIMMMSRRSAQDELRREGEARLKRSQEVTKELSGWRHRLETAKTRSAEWQERKINELMEQGGKQ